jgi:hypothetical protein
MVRNPHFPGIPGVARGDFGNFGRFCAMLGGLSTGALPKTHLLSKFLGWYGTLLKECTRIHRGDIECSDPSFERFARLGSELYISAVLCF